MMNSPLLYSDKKYKGVQNSTGKKASMKKSKLSGTSSANKKQNIVMK